MRTQKGLRDRRADDTAPPGPTLDEVIRTENLTIRYGSFAAVREVSLSVSAHRVTAIIGPSETIPIADGRLTLGTWQNVFLCDFDGPRRSRRVFVSVLS